MHVFVTITIVMFMTELLMTEKLEKGRSPAGTPETVLAAPKSFWHIVVPEKLRREYFDNSNLSELVIWVNPKEVVHVCRS